MGLKLTPEKRKQIIASLKKNGGNVEATRQELSASWAAVNQVRKQEAIKRTVAAGPKPMQLDASPETRERIADKDRIRRLEQQLKEIHRDVLNDDAMRILLGRLGTASISPPKWLTQVPKRGPGGTPEVPVISFADWHIPEVVIASETNGFNEYNLEIAERRIQNLVTAIIHLCRNHGPKLYPGAVVNLIGDFISGALHPELAKTDELEQLPSMLRVVELLVAALDQLLDEFGSLYVPCSAGNHGRQPQKPEFKRYVYKNFDWAIYQLVAKTYEVRNAERAKAGQPPLDIYFDIPDSNEVHYRVWGMRFLMMHGDMMGIKGGDGIIGALGPIARGEVKVSKQASALGKDVDMMIIGHYHQELWLPRITVANCLIGFNEYAKNQLRAVPSAPSQPLFFVHPTRGITSRWNVTVDAPKARGKESWVSFEKRDV